MEAAGRIFLSQLRHTFRVLALIPLCRTHPEQPRLGSLEARCDVRFARRAALLMSVRKLVF